MVTMKNQDFENYMELEGSHKLAPDLTPEPETNKSSQVRSFEIVLTSGKLNLRLIL
jgi:hypothetical protein